MLDGNRSLIAGLYAFIGFLIVVIGYGTFSYYQSASDSAVQRMTETLNAELVASRQAANTRPPQPTLNAAALARAHAQLNELQALLQRNSLLLEKRTALLNQKTAECKTLKGQLDVSIATVLELLENDVTVDGKAAREQVGKELEEDFNQLSAELVRSESLELEQTQQVEQLKLELAVTESEIAAMREQANAELLSLLEQQQIVDTTSRSAFAKMGSTAVPVLVEFLGDDRAEVRAWAASVLGSLGTNGQEAVPALMGMLVDNDQGVRDQAKRSLDLLAN